MIRSLLCSRWRWLSQVRSGQSSPLRLDVRTLDARKLSAVPNRALGREQTIRGIPGRLRASGPGVRPTCAQRPIRRDEDPEVVASQLWSAVHGFVTLELGDHFAQFPDPVRQVLQPMMVNVLVGLGDTAELAEASHTAAIVASLPTSANPV